jgi:LysM repeat protein
VHIVKQGETLYGIALDAGVSLSSLLQANGLSSRSIIRPGQAIRIPPR